MAGPAAKHAVVMSSTNFRGRNMYQYKQLQKEESCKFRWIGWSSHIIVPYLLKLFNCIISAGVYPEL